MRIHTSPIERMLARKVIDADGCWVWPGARNKVSLKHGGGGYGQVRDTVNRKTLMVHIVSYRHFNGEIAPGMHVDHRCHNEDPTCPGRNCKHRLCWNPEHLQLRSLTDNCAAGKAPGQITRRTGVCQRGHPQTDENVKVSIRASGTIKRQCWPCWQAAKKRWRKAA